MDWQNALFAPGWAWSLLSMVLVVGSLVGLYRQLRLQTTQQAIDHLARFEAEFDSERLLRFRLAMLSAERDGSAAEDLPVGVSQPIVNYWERVGSLARKGHLDMDLLWDGGCGFFCQSDWVRIGPSILKGRIDAGNGQIGEQFEWLARRMEAKAKSLGIDLDDAASQAARLDGSIANLETAIRVEEALRSVGSTLPSTTVRSD